MMEAASTHHHHRAATNDHRAANDHRRAAPNHYVVVRARDACGVVNAPCASRRIRGRYVCHGDEQRGQRNEKIFHFWVPPELEWRWGLVYESRLRRLCPNRHFDQGFGNGTLLRRRLNKNSGSTRVADSATGSTA